MANELRQVNGVLLGSVPGTVPNLPLVGVGSCVTLYFNAVAAADETIVIGGTTFTFKDAAAADTQVTRGATAENSLDALLAKVNTCAALAAVPVQAVKIDAAHMYLIGTTATADGTVTSRATLTPALAATVSVAAADSSVPNIMAGGLDTNLVAKVPGGQTAAMAFTVTAAQLALMDKNEPTSKMHIRLPFTPTGVVLTVLRAGVPVATDDIFTPGANSVSITKGAGAATLQAGDYLSVFAWS